jgi:hypothetical protein
VDLDDFNLQILKVRLVEAELSLEGPVGHTATVPEEVQNLIENLIKVHHSPLSPAWMVRRRTRWCADKHTALSSSILCTSSTYEYSLDSGETIGYISPGLRLCKDAPGLPQLNRPKI